MKSEAELIHERYARRTRGYEPSEPWVFLTRQELERLVIRLLRAAGQLPAGDRRLLEVGCGTGSNLLMFLRLGFRPDCLVGSELQADRAVAARHVLPTATAVHQGDSASLELPDAFFDIVFQSLVFSSILDIGMRTALAERMWRFVRPGGGILWYDFTWNNPRNPDVRGVPLTVVRDLFPQGDVRSLRLTLAPPISRLVTRFHPSTYGWFNVIPLLRTHLICWIGKAG